MKLVITSDLEGMQIMQDNNYDVHRLLTAEYIIYPTGCQKVLIAYIGTTKVELTMNLMAIKEHYDIDTIITIGNCGLLNKDWGNTGEICISTAVFQHDVNFEALGYPPGVLPNRAGQSTFVLANNKLIEEAVYASNDVSLPCMLGIFGSGDSFIADSCKAKELIQTFDASFVDTECGAIGQFVQTYNIPFVGIKGVSNFANEYGAENFDAYHPCANRNAEIVLLTMLDAI